MIVSGPLVLPFAGTWPDFMGEAPSGGEGAAVLGRVTLGTAARLGPRAVIRADGHFVRIGAEFQLGARSTVHIAHELYPAIIGDRVLVRDNAVVHACTVQDDCVIEDDVVVLDGSLVESGVVIEAGSVVYPRSTMAGGFAYAGSPAKPVRPLRPGELADRFASAARQPTPPAHASQGSEPGGTRSGMVDFSVFIARTAELDGCIKADRDCSVFFSCDLRAETGEILIGARTNIQDNTIVRCSSGSLRIGQDTTIGHNVRMTDCQIGQRVLIGIGSVVTEGTVVEDDVLLAGGSVTSPGQILESGWLWGGRPARAMARLDEERRIMIARIVGGYCAYAQTYKALQDAMPPGVRALGPV